MLVDQLSQTPMFIGVIVMAISGIVTAAIREYGKTRRTEIGTKDAKSQHKAEIIEAATRPWWRRPR